MRLVNGAWVVTKFEESVDYKSISLCGLAYIETRFVLTGRLIG
jgi:hypothetical protein